MNIDAIFGTGQIQGSAETGQARIKWKLWGDIGRAGKAEIAVVREVRELVWRPKSSWGSDRCQVESGDIKKDSSFSVKLGTERMMSAPNMQRTECVTRPHIYISGSY